MDNNNQDLAKQYQDILDHYSAELASNSSEPPITPENSDSTQKLTPDTPEMITETSPHGLPSEPEVNLPPITPPPVKTYTISTPSEPSPSPQRPSNVFKYLFFVSLLVFLGIFGSIIYTIISNSQNKNILGNDEPTPTEIISNVTPTVVSGSVCEVNDKIYQKGESFTAADGCNSCVCGDDLTISCTEKSCESTPTAKASPTIKSTSSGKNYSSKNINLSLVVPDGWYVEGDTKENGLRIQNYDPATAAGRGYDPIADKGKLFFTIWNTNSITTITSLKKQLNSETACFYMGDVAGKYVIDKEDTGVAGNLNYYTRTSHCSESNLSTAHQKIYVIGPKNQLIKIEPGLDESQVGGYLKQIISTFKFL